MYLLYIIFISILCVLLIVLKNLKKNFSVVTSNSETENDEINEHKSAINNLEKIFTFIIPTLIVSILVYELVIKNRYEAHVMEWINIVIRWAHVVFGIAWIGASFYFIFLENSLNRTEHFRDELAGNLWALHGGGFYYVEKYKSAPSQLPKNLHWFKYEAYFTWLSGFILLALVYYLNASAMMVDKSVCNISSGQAVAIGITALFSGWFIYDALCKSSLLQKKKTFAIIGFIIVCIYAYILSNLLSGRAAYMHIGALLGTIMAGNVFFTIIPSQKALLKAAKLGKPVNPNLGKIAGLRSLHNNYITLPVIFVMISNHFPSTFGYKYQWIILLGLILAGVAVRHYINLHEKGQKAVWMIPFAAIAIISLAIVTAPVSNKKYNQKVSFVQVQPIIKMRCATCHAANPTDDIYKVAPSGLMLENPEDIKKNSDKILVRAVQTKTMPQGNKTNITDKERELIGAWIEQGAEIE